MAWWPLCLLLGDGGGDAGFWSHCFLGRLGPRGPLCWDTRGKRLLGCGIYTAPLVFRPETPLHLLLCPAALSCVAGHPPRLWSASQTCAWAYGSPLSQPRGQHNLSALSDLSPSMHHSAPCRGTQGGGHGEDKPSLRTKVLMLWLEDNQTVPDTDQRCGGRDTVVGGGRHC